jgi:hypothetical protein
MTELHTLELVPNRRKGVRFEGGASKTQRDYYDFVVDGFPLSRLVQDQTSCLWLPPNKWTVEAARRLLLEIPSDFPNNRRALYICAECGDLGCGAVSVVIENDETTFTWRDFAYQNNYEDELYVLPAFDQMGVLKFNRGLYEHLLRGVITEAG